MKKQYVHSLCVFTVFMLSINMSKGQTIFAINQANQLTSFDASTPGTTSTPVTITGIVAGQDIVGSDFRPNTGELYILGYDGSNNSANLYTVNKTSALATQVGVTSITLDLGDGSKVGFDFNPTVDRIRVVSATDKNYRLHPVTGAIVATDGTLSFAGTDANAAANPEVSASAYTKSYIGSGTTTLYNYDEGLNIFTIQNPPNAGTQNTVGASGIPTGDPIEDTDFDIYTAPSTLVQTAYFSLTTTSSSNLYTVDLNTGTASLLGAVGSELKDIAVEIDRTLPATTGIVIYGLQGAANLISFDSENPETILNLVTITGITAGQSIVGMDVRPSNSTLYVLGYNATNGQSQLYTLDPITGIATASGVENTLALGAGLTGVDFNPVADRLRIIASTNKSYRLHPDTGVLTEDSPLAFAPGDINEGTDPFISSVAYTNSYAGTTTTQLFGYDDSLNVIVLQNPPNAGVLTTIAPVSLAVNLNDPTTDVDIFYNTASSANIAFLTTNEGTSTSDKLYTLDVATGTLVDKGLIGFGVSVKDITVGISQSVVTGIFNGNTSNALLQLSVYPNPLSDEAAIEFNLKESADVEVTAINMMGNAVTSFGVQQKNAGMTTYRASTSQLARGIYLFEVKINGIKQGAVKVIK